MKTQFLGILGKNYQQKYFPGNYYLLIDYNGKSTFGKYIATHNLTVKETYSFIFQLIKIIQIFYKGGYSHNDLHMDIF